MEAPPKLTPAVHHCPCPPSTDANPFSHALIEMVSIFFFFFFVRVDSAFAHRSLSTHTRSLLFCCCYNHRIRVVPRPASQSYIPRHLGAPFLHLIRNFRRSLLLFARSITRPLLSSPSLIASTYQHCAHPSHAGIPICRHPLCVGVPRSRPRLCTRSICRLHWSRQELAPKPGREALPPVGRFCDPFATHPLSSC